MKRAGHKISHSPNIIAIDCGNSRVKLSDGLVTLSVDTARINTSGINTSVQSFFDHRINHTVAWSSVSPSTWKHVRSIAAQRRMIDVMKFLHTHSPLKAVLSEGTGHDRILGCVGALFLLTKHHACITIDCGTATTVNLVNARAEFVGGMILPGLTLMSRSLHEHTAQLPSVEFDQPAERAHLKAGLRTADAMRSGALHATVGGIGSAVKEARKMLRNPDAPIFLTGGNAELILPLLKSDLKPTMVPDLVLKGIRGIAERVLNEEFHNGTPLHKE